MEVSNMFQDAINNNFWPSFFEGIMMVVKQPMFWVVIVLVIVFNIIDKKVKKRKK